ncbi:MAG: DUF4145 domain-containing protein [Methanosarcinales archaeon]|nr:MAG: DUF4145 domain-containing protein [Methanosarcinales archaeon]
MVKYSPNSRGICPHCRTTVNFECPDFKHSHPYNDSHFFPDSEKEHLCITSVLCPACLRLVITIETLTLTQTPRPGTDSGIVATVPKDILSVKSEVVVWPQSSERAPIPPEVPAHIVSDYNEAALIFGLSPKASAAISRRCLQTVLGEAGGTKAKDLSKQIDEVLSKLPSHIAESIDAVRNIGNFAAHPQKSQSSGTILDVEPGEAEWTLDVLDTLFDFYYVQPQKLQQKRAALNLKLKEAGKPPMK